MKFKMLALAALVAALPMQSHGAYEMYLKVKGQKQGQMKGGVTLRGHEGSMRVETYNYQVVSPRDAASGLPTGKRMHKPFAVTLELDSAAPQLFNAVTQNENLPEVDFELWGPAAGTGIMHKILTITLSNASIASYSEGLWGPANSPMQIPVTDVSFTFQKITITYVDGAITGTDDWMAPVAMATPMLTPMRQPIGKA